MSCTRLQMQVVEQVADSSKYYIEIRNDGRNLYDFLIQELEYFKTNANPSLEIYLDYSTESNYYFDKPGLGAIETNFFFVLHEILDKCEIDPGKVHLSTGNLLVNTAYNNFIMQFQDLKPLKNVFFQDFWLKQTITMHTDYSENYGKCPKQKYFCSLNGASREHREMTYDYLHRHNLLDKGICSFVWKGISVDGLEDSAGYKHTVQPDDFYKIYDDTFYDLITETNTGYLNLCPWFTDIFLTEKTWRSIYYKRPFLLIGNYQSLKYLKELGFKTFNNLLFDESYDNESNHEIRINRVLQENKRIIETYSLADLQKIIMSSEMSEILQHNYEMINKLAKQHSFTVSTHSNNKSAQNQAI